MKNLVAFIMVVLTMIMVTPAYADDPTATPTPVPTVTPTPHYSFVIPIIEVPIILPTSFQLPPKTPLYVNYTPAPNLNPYGFQTDQFAMHMIAEMLNLQQATLDVMGVVGWIMDFIITMFLIMGSMGLLFSLFRRGVWAVMYLRGGDYRSAWSMVTNRERLYGKKTGKIKPVEPYKMPKWKKEKFF